MGESIRSVSTIKSKPKPFTQPWVLTINGGGDGASCDFLALLLDPFFDFVVKVVALVAVVLPMVLPCVQYHSYRFVILHRYRAGSVDGEVSPMKYDAAGVC